MQDFAETQARRLLRILFLRQCSLSADPASKGDRQDRVLRIKRIEFGGLTR